MRGKEHVAAEPLRLRVVVQPVIGAQFGERRAAQRLRVVARVRNGRIVQIPVLMHIALRPRGRAADQQIVRRELPRVFVDDEPVIEALRRAARCADAPHQREQRAVVLAFDRELRLRDGCGGGGGHTGGGRRGTGVLRWAECTARLARRARIPCIVHRECAVRSRIVRRAVHVEQRAVVDSELHDIRVVFDERRDGRRVAQADALRRYRLAGAFAAPFEHEAAQRVALHAERDTLAVDDADARARELGGGEFERNSGGLSSHGRSIGWGGKAMAVWPDSRKAHDDRAAHGDRSNCGR